MAEDAADQPQKPTRRKMALLWAMTSLAQLFRRPSPEIMFLARFLLRYSSSSAAKPEDVTDQLLRVVADIVDSDDQSARHAVTAVRRSHCVCDAMYDVRDPSTRLPMQTTVPLELSTPPACV